MLYCLWSNILPALYPIRFRIKSICNAVFVELHKIEETGNPFFMPELI
jgi:hypothetical protein